MDYTRKEWINILGQVLSERKQISENNSNFSSINNRLKLKRVLIMSPIIFLMTMGPWYILYYIDTHNIPGLTPFLFYILPGIIPGLYYIYDLIYVGLVLLFFYGLFSIRRDHSVLYKIGFFRRIKSKIERKHILKRDKYKQQSDKIANTKSDVIIPPRYKDSDSIKELQHYLINQRATNLTEAIEIYELEHHRRQLEFQRYQQIESMKRAEAITARRNLINRLKGK